MKLCRRKSPGLHGLAVVLSLTLAALPVFQARAFSPAVANGEPQNTERLSRDTTIYSVAAVASPEGVLLTWKTSFELDNIGFNVYRERGGLRTKINREIVPGSAFIVGQNVPMRAGNSYSWFDAAGTADSLYSIEAVSMDGTVKSFGRIAPAWQNKIRSERALVDSNQVSINAAAPSAQRTFPAADAQVITTTGAREDQWAIASQVALKIAIKRDGWYRVTQQQMVAAGFNPVVDISNLRLFLNAQELAIRTSRTNGQFVNGDFIEFYGQGVDTPTTDSNTYYLTAGTTVGKRIPGGSKRQRDSIRPESNSTTAPSDVALPAVESNPSSWFWWAPASERTAPILSPSTGAHPTEESNRRSLKIPAVENVPDTSPSRAPAVPEPPSTNATQPVKTLPAAPEKRVSLQDSTPAPAKVVQKSRSKRRKKKQVKRKYAHPVFMPVGGNAVTFNNTVQRKDRLVYFVSLINGDAENFFGAVLSSLAIDQTLTAPNPANVGTAQLELALQGASSANHVIDVQLNGTSIGTVSFFGLEHKVQTINIPASQILNGTNTVHLTPQPGNGLGIVDYLRLTYPHTFTADAGSLRFSLAASESARIDGFNSSAVRVIDYTDPLNVKIIKPLTEANGSGFTAQLPSTQAQRLLYAIGENDFDASATLSLNQPSTLNGATNAADLLIVAHSTLMASATPLVTLRTGQGLTVKVVDVEDIYDEFSFGAHGPQALKDFLLWSSQHWATAPRYVIFLGDASLDPRNYEGLGNFDLVPTKLVDATFSETASDDWLTDFNNDGSADIPVGRLPVRTPAEANLVISKIVNFVPSNTPNSALLVADTQGTYFFNFEQANTQVQTLLPAGMAVVRVDRRLEPSDPQARADVNAAFNSGQALVNYSGHGNVDTWTGGSIFSTADALALTNGNKLPFVVVMDCLNGYFQDPQLQGIAEALMKATNGGAVAAFASSGSTLPDGQHAMSSQLYTTLYGSQPIALGDAIKVAKTATLDIDVRRTWIFFGDPSRKIR